MEVLIARQHTFALCNPGTNITTSLAKGRAVTGCGEEIKIIEKCPPKNLVQLPMRVVVMVKIEISFEVFECGER